MSTNNVRVTRAMVKEMLTKNEVGNTNPYKISDAKAGKSGYSFGPCQWDLSKNQEGRDIFKDILTNAKDADNKNIFTIDEVNDISTKANNHQDISAYEDRINQALQTDYGKATIDQKFDDHIDNAINRLDNLISELKDANGANDPTATYIENNPFIQLELIDYDNQLHIDGINTPGHFTNTDDRYLIKLLKTGATRVNGTTDKVEGDFDLTDYLDYLFKTKWANNLTDNGARDLLRRLSNILALAYKYKINLSERDKQLLNELIGLYSQKLSAKDRLAKVQQLVTKASGTTSPIALDLDNDGIETTKSLTGTYFDHNANGFKEQTGWVNSDDGLLVMDRDGNEIIDNGKELFGDQTILSNGTRATNGFQALAELDDNKDGKIDANDTVFNQLRVWEDFNGDGYSSEDELYTLDELGIKSINTGYTSTNVTDANGNTIKENGTFTRTDGTTGTAADVWFQVDNMYTVANEWLDVPDDIAALPDLQGYGNVYDLQQAMVRDESGHLKNLVEQFAAETDAAARHGLVTQILYAWTGVENVDPLSRAARMIYGNAIGDARKLATLEAFMGEGYFGTWCWNERDPNPHGPQAHFFVDKSFLSPVSSVLQP